MTALKRSGAKRIDRYLICRPLPVCCGPHPAVHAREGEEKKKRYLSLVLSPAAFTTRCAQLM